MTEYHRLSSDDFDLLATGRPDGRTTRFLRDTRYSRTLLILWHLIGAQRIDHEVAEHLATAAARAPEAVADVLAYPWVAVWATSALTRRWSPADDTRLRAVAAAAALRAGLPNVPVPERRLVLPTLGLLENADPLERSGREVCSIPELVRLPGWHPIARCDVSFVDVTMSVLIDDVDPYRDCVGLAVAPRLSASERAGWQRMIAEAAALLASHAADRYVELAAGMSSVVPLRPSAPTGVAATHRDGFGGFAATAPATAAELATAMVHEFAHSKLNAVDALYELFRPDDPDRYFVPWRRDPRPLRAAMHGAYAFTAVADLWNALRAVPDLETSASRQFAVVRQQVDRVIAEIAGAPGLTDAGQRFARRLGSSVAHLMSQPVPAEHRRRALDRLRSAERAWRERWPSMAGPDLHS